MTTFHHSPAAFAIAASEKAHIRSSALLLRPTEDGWSLVTPAGEVIYRGLGTGARRRCLEIAYERGAPTVLS
jgi:hypothetical protein